VGTVTGRDATVWVLSDFDVARMPYFSPLAVLRDSLHGTIRRITVDVEKVITRR